MSIDLHIHSTASDGSTSPQEVVSEALKAGLHTMALADHETTAGYSIIKDLCEEQGIRLIPGVELLTHYRDREIHLLGYFNSIDCPSFQLRLKELRDARTNCAWETVEKLKGHGFKINWDDVQAISTLGGPISKGHIMHAIYNAGYIRNSAEGREIMTTYLNAGGLAYTPYYYNFPEAVELILESQGVPILAHPGLIGDDTMIPELLSMGVLGMEVFYYYFNNNRQELIDKYKEMAEDKGILLTGGSDFHGIYAPVPLGEIMVPETILPPFYQLLATLK